METAMRLTLALIAVIASSSALATPGPSTAQLVAPARAPAVVTEAGVRHCDGARCTDMANAMLRETVTVCTGVADSAGRVAAFIAAGYAFTGADLVRCNRHVKS